MSWEIRLWCNQGCHKVIGQVEEVSTEIAGHRGKASIHDVYNIMREHEVEAHGGKS